MTNERDINVRNVLLKISSKNNQRTFSVDVEDLEQKTESRSTWN